MTPAAVLNRSSSRARPPGSRSHVAARRQIHLRSRAYALWPGWVALLALIALPMVLGLLPGEARASQTSAAISSCEFHAAALHALERGLHSAPELPAPAPVAGPRPGPWTQAPVEGQPAASCPGSLWARAPARAGSTRPCSLPPAGRELIDPTLGSRLLC